MKDNQLLNGAAIYFLVIALGIIASGFVKYGKKHKVANHDVLQATLNNDFLFKYNQLARAGFGDFLFVDLRSEGEFKAGHLEGAVNIKPDAILDGKSLKTLRKANKPIVLYSSSQEKSVAIGMLLKSAGIDEVRVLAGNYQLAKEHLQEPNNLEMLHYDQEKAKWNYGAFFKTAPPDRSEPPITPVMLELMGGC